MPLSTGESESIGSIGGYTLVDRLGSGGMGVVYLGRSASGRQVAVKVVHAQYAQDEEFRVRFRQEISAARRVSGAFTAPVVDADPDAEVPWMATLYVPGRTLSEIVAKEGPLSGHALRTLALGLVEALRDIHQAGVVHRDLKPSNVLLAEDGPRVIDFGISRAADNQALTVTGRLIGTPPFMSPEQFASPRDVTAASDVFSLGSLLVYAATGNRPFDGGSPYMTGYQVVHEQPTLDGVPEPLRSIAERCLDKDATARPDLTELHRLFRDLPDVATAPATPAPSGPSTVVGGRRAARRHGDTTTSTGSGRRGRRVRLLVALGAALAVTAVTASVYYLVARPKSTEGTPGGRTTASRAAASPAAALPMRLEALAREPHPGPGQGVRGHLRQRLGVRLPVRRLLPVLRGVRLHGRQARRRLRPRRVAGLPHPADHAAARRPGRDRVHLREAGPERARDLATGRPLHAAPENGSGTARSTRSGPPSCSTAASSRSRTTGRTGRSSSPSTPGRARICGGHRRGRR